MEGTLNIRKSDTEMFVREISKESPEYPGNITGSTTTGSCNRRSQGSQSIRAYAGVSLCQETQ